MRFHFSSWVTKKNSFNTKANNGKPAPMRIMFGTIIKETEKSYIVEVSGKPEPTTQCLHCGRKLTNKVSQLYGLGPICGQHFYITGITEANLEQYFDEIRQKMASVKWRGIVPKTAVMLEYEDIHTISFSYGDKIYKVVTSDETKIKEIYQKADKVLTDDSSKG